jgi:flagella basal body P-ring formation protein FlgA
VLTAVGRALADGAIGDTIRVLNTHSNTVVDAVVENSSVVVVGTRRRLAMN